MRHLFLFLFIISITAISYAEDISITCDVDKRELTLDDQLVLSVTVTGNAANIPQPKIPELKGFTAYSSGRSQNISIINGQISSSVAFNYILVPKDAGDYTIGPFSIDYNNKTYTTQAVNVKVLPRSTSNAQQQAEPSEPGQEAEQPKGKELFIETYVDKLRAYVNEQITLTFAFYQAVDLFESPGYSPPSTTGFWAEDMPPQKKYYKMINGRRYLVTEIKTALFGISPGEFTIGPARLEATVEDLDRFFSRNSFDVFDRDPFSMFRRGKPIVLNSEPINVEILPLPEENKPPDFKGDVGSFEISGVVDKPSVEENQPVTLKIKISGKGNIKTITPPFIREMQDVRFYDSASSENISKTDYMVQGDKIFEKVIIPKKPGDYTIGPIDYVYFDPVLKQYIKKSIEPIKIAAIKAKEENAEKPQISPTASKEDVELLGRDICYIKLSKPRLVSMNRFLYKNKWFILFNIMPLLVLISLYIYELHRRRLKQDVGYARYIRAKSSASKRLKQARVFMHKEQIKEFYAEIYKAVIEYIGDKFNIAHSSITKDLLEKTLKDRGMEKKVIDEVNDLFDICDMARFASAGFTKTDMEKAIEEAMDVIAELEKLR